MFKLYTAELTQLTKEMQTNGLSSEPSVWFPYEQKPVTYLFVSRPQTDVFVYVIGLLIILQIRFRLLGYTVQKSIFRHIFADQQALKRKLL